MIIMMKKLFTAAAACVLSLAMTSAVFAGAWKIDETTGIWHYDYTGRGVQDGYLKSQWAWIDGNHDRTSECYHFDANGNLDVSTVVEGYDVNELGQWTVNGVVQTRTEGSGSSGAADLSSAVDLLHTTAADSNYTAPYETATTASGLTWTNGLLFTGGVDHLAFTAYNFDKNYDTMTLVFSPQAGQDTTLTGRVTVSSMTTGKTLYSSGKFNASSNPKSVSINVKGEKGVRISLIRGFNLLFDTIAVQ